MTHSVNQQKFLNEYKRNKIFIRSTRILIFVLFLSLWEVSARVGWIDSFIFSSPSRIVMTFFELLSGHGLLEHVGITLMETIISFLLVILFSTGLATILWIFPKCFAVLEPYFVVLNSLPKSALAPLLIVWLGANMRTIIIAGMSVAIFGATISLYTGFREIDSDKQKLIQTLGGSKWDTLTKVILPASIPIQISTMKVNIGLCLVGVVIGEFIGAKQGLGYLIIYSSQTFKLDWMLMSIVILCVMAMLLYQILNTIEKFITK